MKSWARVIKHSVYTLFTGMVIVFVYILYLHVDLPSIERLENYDPDLVTRIYSADGKLLNELYFEKRVFVELDQIPQQMRDAVVAKEDRRFYEHWGISLRDVFRAVIINTVTLSYRSGFSSLTQQLARNLYDTIGFKKTITRKIKEVITAIHKGNEDARRQMVSVSLKGATLPHEVFSHYDGARVLLRPASPGTGIIAGKTVRAVLESAGVRDVLSKSLGSNNPTNVAKATLQALRQLRLREEVMAVRDKN